MIARDDELRFRESICDWLIGVFCQDSVARQEAGDDHRNDVPIEDRVRESNPQRHQSELKEELADIFSCATNNFLGLAQIFAGAVLEKDTTITRTNRGNHCGDEPHERAYRPEGD